MKAREFLDAGKIGITEEVDARKEKIGQDEAWDRFRNAEKISIGKGKKQVSIAPAEASRDEILVGAIGRSGTLRAPTLKIGARFLVGFNDEMYQDFFSE